MHATLNPQQDLKKCAALVYENHGVAEADVLEAHAAYQHHAPVSG